MGGNMAFTHWTLILGAVLLGSAAQLLLKAGTNTVGQFAFTSDNLLPVTWQLASQPHILGGVFAYGLPHGLDRLCFNRTCRMAFSGRASFTHALAGYRSDYIGRFYCR